jgi:hypothetical protein
MAASIGAYHPGTSSSAVKVGLVAMVACWPPASFLSAFNFAAEKPINVEPLTSASFDSSCSFVVIGLFDGFARRGALLHLENAYLVR